MTKKYGGKRPGSGRPKGSQNKKTIEEKMALAELRKKVLEEWEDLISKKIELAKGIYVIKPIKIKGKVVDVKVYQKEPDGQALEYLFSMVVGRPLDKLQVIEDETMKVDKTDDEYKRYLKFRRQELKIDEQKIETK